MLWQRTDFEDEIITFINFSIMCYIGEFTSYYCAAADEVNRKEEIQKFIARHKDMNHVHVTEMRHILPMLLMEGYPSHYAPCVRKGKQKNLTYFG